MGIKLGFDQTFTGLVRGVVSEDKQNYDQSKQWVEHNFCVEGKDFVTHKFKITRDDVDKNIMPKLEELKGQTVTFQCSSSHRAWKDRVFTDHYYQGDLKKAS